MIRITLSTLMGQRRIKMRQLARQASLNINTIWNMYHERTQRIDLETLDKLCRTLKVQPGDLLVYEPDEDYFPLPNPRTRIKVDL